MKSKPLLKLSSIMNITKIICSFFHNIKYYESIEKKSLSLTPNEFYLKSCVIRFIRKKAILDTVKKNILFKINFLNGSS